ncbi:MAG: hydroxymethylbilane synthase [Acetivibrionales bacterium]|jgi:hydroxymethylbilane synthase
MKKLIKVGSRKSALALAQSRWVISRVQSKFPDIEFEIVGIQTRGDIILDKRLDKIGGKGLFIKELENALLDGTIDIAVHSAKDMPAKLPEGLVIPIVSCREDPRDVLVTADGRKLDQLESGAVIGTSSARREVQILEKRPDIYIKTLRGNINTRLEKALNNKGYDAIMLAAAGLKRLGLEEKCVEYFAVDDIIPAVGQGILAIETRVDEDIEFLMESVHCEKAAIQLSAERAFLKKLNGGCTTPMAAHAIIEGESIKIYGMLATDDKTFSCRDMVKGNKSKAVQLGEQLAVRLSEKLEKRSGTEQKKSDG